MRRSKSLKKKRLWRRRKKIIIVYTIRAVVYIILFMMLTLMVCGCLFIYEHLISKNTAVITDAVGYGIETDEVNISTEDETKDFYSGYAVILDAGHGGQDGGTHIGSTYEKDINLSMVLILQEKLEEYGITVINTRTQDIKMSLEERVTVANTGNANLFISIHCNSYEDDTSIYGFQCYYDRNSETGKSLAEHISAEVEKGSITNVRNAKAENYYVTREIFIPAVLIEIGYITNKKERDNLMNKSYLENMADLIVSGILDQLDNRKETL